ncbi:MAG: hypothetical protein AAF497_25695 [Planctomycetota bacterium]
MSDKRHAFVSNFTTGYRNGYDQMAIDYEVLGQLEYLCRWVRKSTRFIVDRDLLRAVSS